MAEAALGLGASVITFLALAGQALRGCQYIHDFIEDAKRSSKDLGDISRQVEHLRDAIFGLQDLQDRARRTWADRGVATQAIHAMESGCDVLEDVEKFFKTFDHHKSEWWIDLKVASKRRQLAIYNRRLEAAKVQIIMILSHLTLTSALSQDGNIQFLTAALESSADTTHHQLSDLKHAILALEDSTNNRNRNLQEERDLILQRVDELPMKLGSVIQTAITAAFHKQSLEIQAKVSNDSLKAFVPLKEPQVISFEWHPGSQKSRGSERVKAARRVTRHAQRQIDFSIYFATISVLSAVAVHRCPSKDECNTNEHQDAHPDADLLTTIDVRLRSPIVTKGALLSIISHGTRTSLLDSSFKLRVYSLVLESSPIVEACKQGNTAAAYELFSTGRASPQDVVLLDNPTNSGVNEVSLRTYVWMTWIRTVRELSMGEFDENSHRFRGLSNRLDQQYQIFYFWRNPSSICLDCHPERSTLGGRAQDTLYKSGNTLAVNGWHDLTNPIDSGPCLWDIIQLISSCHPALSESITKMIRLFTVESTDHLAENATPYQQEVFWLCYKLMPELSSCFKAFDSPGVIPAQHVHDQIGIVHADVSASSFCSIEVGTGIYSLLRDPDALHFGAFLRHQAQPNSVHMVDTCILTQQSCDALKQNNNVFCEAAVKARIVACIRSGMDIQSSGSSHETVLAHFVRSGELKVLQLAWAEAGLKEESLLCMVEEYRCFIIIEELNALRLLSRLMKHKENIGQNENAAFSRQQNSLNCDLEMVKSEGYQKCFPEELQCINTYLNQHDPDSEGHTARFGTLVQIQGSTCRFLPLMVSLKISGSKIPRKC